MKRGVLHPALLAAAVFTIVVVAGLGLTGAQAASLESASTVVIHGSASAGPESSNSPLVLRGTPAPESAPPAAYSCAPGYVPDPSLGCVSAGYATAPYDIGYWPFSWFDRVAAGAPRHRFRHGFARADHLRIGHAGGFGRR
jgi:hypothetical protein